MKKPQSDIYFSFIVVILCSTPCHAYPPAIDWRFGFEYNEIGAWSQPHHEQLLTKLEQLKSQGGINVNGAGSWSSMQISPASPITFSESDATVLLFQKHGFSLICLKQIQSAGVPQQQDQHSEKFMLSQNFPNPFNDSTVVAFSFRILWVVSTSIYKYPDRVVPLSNERCNQKLDCRTINQTQLIKTPRRFL